MKDEQMEKSGEKNGVQRVTDRKSNITWENNQRIIQE